MSRRTEFIKNAFHEIKVTLDGLDYAAANEQWENFLAELQAADELEDEGD